MQRLIILMFLLFVTAAATAQQADTDLQQQNRKINRLNWQLYRQQQTLDSVQQSLSIVVKENDSLKVLLFTKYHKLEDSIAQLNHFVEKGFQNQQKKMNRQMLKMRERFFILAAIMLLLAVAVFAMFFYFRKRSLENAYAMDVRLDEQVTRIQHKLEEKTSRIQNNIDEQVNQLEKRLNQGLFSKISTTKEELLADKRLLHATALAMANELQDINNIILEGLTRKQIRKYRKRFSGLKKQLKRRGYDIEWFDGKKIREEMIVDIENMPFNEAIGKRVLTTLRPQLIFGEQLIQKALLRVRET